MILHRGPRVPTHLRSACVGFAAHHPLPLLLERATKLPWAQELSASLDWVLLASDWVRDGRVAQAGPIATEPGLLQQQLRTKLALSPWTWNHTSWS